MKNYAVQRFASAALALAMLVSVSVSVSAKPVSSKNINTTSASAPKAPSTSNATTQGVAQEGYTILSTGSSFQIQRGGKTIAEYNVKSTDATLTVSKSGNVVLTLVSANGQAMNINVSSQQQLNFMGNFSSITISGAVPSDRSITVNATVKNLNINSIAPVTIGANSVITSTKVGVAAATVNVLSGAKMTSVSAVKTSAITGFTGKVSPMSPVTNTASPVAKSINNNTTIGIKMAGQSTSTAGKDKVYLDMQEADSSNNTDDIRFASGSNTVELDAKDGVSLGLAMKDIQLKVTRDTDKDNDGVGGQWKWVDAVSTSYTSGTYIYRFYPSLTEKYPTIDVKVIYKGSGNSSSKTIGKPGISFIGSSHGKGGDIRIEVTLPNGIKDDSTLYVKCGDKEIEYDLDEDDSGDERSYTVTVDPSNYEDGDKVKISVKLKSGGSTASSKTINYLVEKPSK